MPSSATITAFYDFTANTRARASQVQNNFDMFRGHIIPIEPLTATSADVTYDLGSDEHRWRTGYFGAIDFDRSTSTASVAFASDLSTNTGEMVFKTQGNDIARLTRFGIMPVVGATPTTTADKWQIGWSATISSNLLGATNTSVTNSTTTITTIGRPVQIELVEDLSGGYHSNTSDNIYFSASQAFMTQRLYICRGTTTSRVFLFKPAFAFGNYTTTAFNGGGIVTTNIRVPPSTIRAIDFAPAGQHNYFLYLEQALGEQTSFPGSTGNPPYCRLMARELR